MLQQHIKTILKIGTLSSLLIAALTNPIHASEESEIRDFLVEFHKNPQETMSRRPVKKNADGTVADPASLFSQEAIDSGEFIEERDAFRARMCTIRDGIQVCLKDAISGRARLPDLDPTKPETDRVENFLETTEIIRNLRDMDHKKLRSAQADRKPWSDSYWPMAKGLLAFRYNDGGNPGVAGWSWPSNSAYGLSHLSGVGDSASASEKYDYLIGDKGYSLSTQMWLKGKVYQEQYGAVAHWMGICHGWAPAAIVFDEPVKSTVVRSIDGGSVRFYPSDIRGLASVLWAFGNGPYRFVGGRCKVRNPARDAVGRVIADECFDTNPGTWHVAITNQLGISHRSFVMDATYDFEVWNHPIFAYDYTYYNPQTLEPSPNFRRAVIPMSDFSLDKFKKYRAPDAKFIVGIAMNVTYAVETNPSHFEGNSFAPKTARYIYDLELDAQGNIIGGEWYTIAHPDFIWTPTAKARATSEGDSFIKANTWTGDNPFPKEWREAGIIAGKNAAPLAVVVETLVKRSSVNPTPPTPAGSPRPQATTAPTTAVPAASPAPVGH